MRVLLPIAGEHTELVLAHLRSWSASGLLAPFCWWPTPAGEVEAGDQRVLLVAGPRADERSLAQALHGVDPDAIEFLALLATPPDGRLDAGFPVGVSARLRTAADIVAFQPGRPPRCTMVVVTPRPDQPFPAELFSRRWAANIVVAAEDRATPRDTNILADSRDADVHAAHAAHAIATIGDIWRSCPRRQGVLATLLERPGGAGGEALVRIVRCYSRIVDYGHLPDEVAGEVFRRRDGAWPNPDRDHYDRVDGPRELLRHVARRYLRKHARVLGLSEFVPLEMEARPRISMLAALRWLWRMLVGRLRAAPFELTERLLEGFVDSAAAFIERKVGPDRPFDVKRWRDRACREGDLLAAADDLEPLLMGPEDAVSEVWSDLVQTSLGLIDGSPLPAGIDGDWLLRGDRRIVVTDPSLIVPDPGEQDAPVCDPRERPQDAERYGDTPLWIIGASIAAELERARAVLDRDEPEPVPEVVVAVPPRRPRRARRIAGVLARGVFGCALLAGAAYGIWTQLPLLARPFALLALAFVAVWLLARAALRAMLRRERPKLERLQRDIDAFNRALERSIRRGDAIRLEGRYVEFRDWAEIIGRIAHRPWVGEPAAQSAVRRPVDPCTLPAALDVAVARTQPKLAWLAQAAREEIFHPRWLTGLYMSVETAVVDALRESSSALTGVMMAQRRRPTADTSQDPESDRRRLRDAVRNGDHRHLDESDLANSLLALLDGLPLDVPADGTVRVRDDEQPLPSRSSPPDLAALTARLGASVVRVRTLKAGAHADAGGVIVSSGGLIATTRHAIEAADGITVELHDGTELEARHVRSAPATDLALIAVERAFDGVAVRCRFDCPAIGEPVIAFDCAPTSDGDPALGVIGATDERTALDDRLPGVGSFRVLHASYRSPAGEPGSPVFDLEGALVGVHTAASAAPAADGVELRCAVPVADLEPLLAGVGEARPAARSASERGPAGEHLPPTRFLTAIDLPCETLAFNPAHWRDASRGRARVEAVAPAPLQLDGGRLGPLSGGAQFLHPIRVGAHRVEISRAVQPDELAGAADGGHK